MAQQSMVEAMKPPSHSMITEHSDDLRIGIAFVDDDDDDQSATAKVDSAPKSLSRNTSSSGLNAGAPAFVPRSSSTSSNSSSSSSSSGPSNHQHQHHHQTAPAGPRLVLMQHAAHHFSVPPPPLTSPMFHVPSSYQTYGVAPPAGGCFPLKHQEPDPPEPLSSANSSDHHHHHHHPSQQPTTKNALSGLSDEVRHKILNQVEYYFSDANLATTDHLIRYISKDPDGFVPLSVVASFKKIKALVSSHHQLAAVLRKSAKLIVSDDGKKIRRQHPFTESDMEELQSRIVIAENLPEDHSYQSLMRIFSAVGSVKTIRTCQPQISNGGGASAASRSSKMDNMLFSNKLHAFVEYETLELAEKAVTELNDERNWRSGLRLRLLLKRTSKPAQARGRKFRHEGEGNVEEDDLSTSEQLEDRSQSTDVTLQEHNMEENIYDKEIGGARRGGRGGRGRGKGRGRGQHHNNNNNNSNRGSHIVGTPPASNLVHNEHAIANKQPPGPRMPDGTRGFAMGRGKPVVAADVM